jgi:hypothetical protein
MTSDPRRAGCRGRVVTELEFDVLLYSSTEEGYHERIDELLCQLERLGRGEGGNAEQSVLDTVQKYAKG